MKIKFVTYSVVVFFHMLATAGAVEYYVSNSSNGVTDNAGNLLSSLEGSAAFGYFDSDLAVTEATSAADLLDADWHIAGDSSGDSDTSFNKNTPLNGTFTTNYNLTNPGFHGKPVYLVLGNGNSLSASTEFFVYKFAVTFDILTDVPNPQELYLNFDSIDSAKILIGSIGSSQVIQAGGTAAETFKMDILNAVPVKPALNSLSINNDSADTESQTVTLNHSKGGATPTEYLASENADFSGAVWQPYVDDPIFQLSAGSAIKTVYLKIRNAEGESSVGSDTINYSDEASAQIPVLVSVSINDGAEDTESRIVTLNHTKSGEAPTEYLASENDDFLGADWLTYTDNPSFQLSAGSAVKTVYLKLKNSEGESSASSDTINYQKVDSGDLLEHPDAPADSPGSTDSYSITAAAGKYSGFLRSSSGAVIGYFKSFKVSSSGKFSAKVTFDGTNYSLKGSFEENGHYFIETTTNSGEPFTVDLQLVQTDAGANKVQGTISAGSESADVVLVTPGSTSDWVGAYTLLIPGEEDEAHGYGLMAVTSAGAAKIKGVLGDGSKWAAKCLVTNDGEMPLYAALYRKAGSLGGMIRFREVAAVSNCDGEVHWSKPGGVSMMRNLIGSRFSNTGARMIASIPETVPNVEANIGKGTAEEASSLDFEWTTANKINYAGPEKVKIKVSTKNGQIKGTAAIDGAKWKVEGVVFQAQDLAAGIVTANGKQPRSLVIAPLLD